MPRKKRIEGHLGRMGEDTVRGWLNQINATPNPSSADEKGWDVLVQFNERNESNISIPLDKWVQSRSCFIQVKSTDDVKKKRISVPLSNLYDLIMETDLPVFFLILNFNYEKVCQQAYLVHLDDKYIYKFQERLRKLSLEGKEVRLNNKTMDIVFDTEHQLPVLDGSSLRKIIFDYIGDSMREYSSNKDKLRANVGYEIYDKYLEIDPVIPNEYINDKKQYYVDLSVGLISNIKAYSLKQRDMRFGLAFPNPEEVFTDVDIFINSEAGIIADVIFIAENGGKIILPMKMRVSDIVPFEDEYFKVLLRNRFIDIEITPNNPKNKPQMRIKEMDAESYTIQEITYLSEFNLFINENKDIKIEVIVEIKGNLLFGLIADNLIKVNDDSTKIAILIKLLNVIINYFDIKDVSIKLQDIGKYEDDIYFMGSFIEYSNKIFIQLKNTNNEMNKEYFFPIKTSFLLDKYMIAMVFVFFGNINEGEIDNTIVHDFIVQDVKIFFKDIFNKNEDIDLILREQEKQVIDLYQRALPLLDTSEQ